MGNEEEMKMECEIYKTKTKFIGTNATEQLTLQVKGDDMKVVEKVFDRKWKE